MEPAAQVEGDQRRKVRVMPEMPEPAERATVTKRPLPSPQREKVRTPGVNIAAATSKPSTPKRHPFLRPDEQKRETTAKNPKPGKRQHRYAKARKAHQRQGRKSSNPVLVLGQ